MRSVFPLAVAVVVGLSFSLGPKAIAAEQPIRITSQLTEPVDGVAKIMVEIQIDEGWHAYETTDESNPARELEINLDLPDGVVAAGRWERPDADDYDDGSLIYKGNCRFTRELSVSPGDADRKIGVSVSYQICTSKTCLPPTDFQIDLPLAAEKKSSYPFENEYFSTPELLMIDGAPLNNDLRQGYVSPSLHDIDNDGTMELLTGDVAGKVRVYRNKNAGQKGEPVWSDDGFLRNTRDSDIIAKNW